MLCPSMWKINKCINSINGCISKYQSKREPEHTHIDLLCNPQLVYQTSGLECLSTWQTLFSQPPLVITLIVLCKYVSPSYAPMFQMIRSKDDACGICRLNDSGPTMFGIIEN